MKTKVIAAAIALIFAAGAATAATVSPSSYDMRNGASGSYNYWDDAYTGSGNNRANHATLSGGLGDLTDGVIATQSWHRVEGPRGPHGPYVGWLRINPVITFNFDTVHTFNSMTFHFDDANGYGGVSQPGAVSVNGLTKSVPVNAGSAPFSFTFDLGGLTTDTLTTTIFRSNRWVFLSEVTFDAKMSSVPVPASLPLLAAGFGGLTLLARRKRKAT